MSITERAERLAANHWLIVNAKANGPRRAVLVMRNDFRVPRQARRA